MAYRQYIGARYVPLFDGAWSATKNYEPLTVVEDGNGNSYTSKKDVPAGTPLTDRDHWMLTATFSGAVEQLRREVNDHETRITEDEVKISSNESRIEGLDANVAGLNESIGTLHTKVSTLENFTYGAGNAVFIGDSYVQAVSLGEQQNKRFSTQICERYGYTEFNFADGGSGFLPLTGETDYLMQINNAVSTMTEEQRFNTKLLMICSGRNDVGNPSRTLAVLSNRVKEVDTVAKNNFPNAKIVYALMMWDYLPLPVHVLEVEKWFKIILRQLDSVKHGALVIPNVYKILQGQPLCVLPDGVHWTVEGHTRVANTLISCIEGNGMISNGTFMHFTSFQQTGISGDISLYGNENNDLYVYGDITIQNGALRNTFILNNNLSNSFGLITGGNMPIELYSVNNNGTFKSAQIAIGYDGTNMKVTLMPTQDVPADRYRISKTLPSGVWLY